MRRKSFLILVIVMLSLSLGAGCISEEVNQSTEPASTVIQELDSRQPGADACSEDLRSYASEIRDPFVTWLQMRVFSLLLPELFGDVSPYEAQAMPVAYTLPEMETARESFGRQQPPGCVEKEHAELTAAMDSFLGSWRALLEDPEFDPGLHADTYALVYKSEQRFAETVGLHFYNPQYEEALEDLFSWYFSAEPDRRLVATIEENLVELSEAGSQMAAAPTEVPRLFQTKVSFSPDGQRVVSSLGVSVDVWDVATGENLLSLEEFTDDYTQGTRPARYSPDMSWLIVASVNGLYVRDAESGELLTSINNQCGNDFTGPPLSWDVSPDGSLFAVGCDNYEGGANVHLYEAGDGDLRQVLEGHTFSSNLSLEFSPDGRHLLTSTGHDLARLWDVESGSLVTTLGANKVSWATFTAGGMRIAAAETGILKGTVYIWDSTSLDEIFKTDVDDFRLWPLSLNADGSLVAVAGTSGQATATIWSTDPARLLFSFGEDGDVREAILSPDGALLAVKDTSEGPRWSVWSVDQGEALYELPDAFSVDISKDSTRIAVGTDDGSLVIYDAATSDVVWAIDLR